MEETDVMDFGYGENGRQRKRKHNRIGKLYKRIRICLRKSGKRGISVKGFCAKLKAMKPQRLRI